jgi:hypothetical protein
MSWGGSGVSGWKTASDSGSRLLRDHRQFGTEDILDHRFDSLVVSTSGSEICCDLCAVSGGCRCS